MLDKLVVYQGYSYEVSMRIFHMLLELLLLVNTLSGSL
jgi:hypothetical protein